MTPPHLSLQDRVLRWRFLRAEGATVNGIRISVGPGSIADRAACVGKVGAALRLLEEHDPRRLRRLRQDVDGIFLHGTTGDLGGFWWRIRLVTLRFDHTLAADTSSAQVASTLVHEGTHARLFARGIDYAPERRARVEAACYRAELAFARRLPDPEGLVAAAEANLARDPGTWSYEAIQQQDLQSLRELGTPPWLVRYLERYLRLRDRVMSLWKGPPPGGPRTWPRRPAAGS